MTEELIKQLEALGWKQVYYTGNGTECPIQALIDGEQYIVGDIEKSNILVPPDCLWEKPEKYDDYY